MEEGLEGERPQVSEWETLKKELKVQFLPTNVVWLERVFEKHEAYRFNSGLCERVQLLDAEHKEHVQGR